MNNKTLCVIGARGGSKGVPGKNVKLIAGKPLIGWTVERAMNVNAIDQVVVSTDCPDIAKVAQQFGAEIPFMRPAELATSKAGKFGVWKHALQECEEIYGAEYDWFLDMDCTNPLLETDDVERMLQQFETELENNSQLDGMFTVSAPHRNPYFNQVEEDDFGLLHLSKKLENNIESRQQAPKVWDIVAGLYLFKTSFIKENDYLLNGKLKGYEIPREKGFDLDEPLDEAIIEFLLKRKCA